jgi:hypothetical protein
MRFRESYVDGVGNYAVVIGQSQVSHWNQLSSHNLFQ